MYLAPKLIRPWVAKAISFEFCSSMVLNSKLIRLLLLLQQTHYVNTVNGLSDCARQLQRSVTASSLAQSFGRDTQSHYYSTLMLNYSSTVAARL